MKHRLLTLAMLLAAVGLAGCAPQQTGASPSASQSAEAEAQAESEAAAPSIAAESPDASDGGGNSGPDDYGY